MTERGQGLVAEMTMRVQSWEGAVFDAAALRLSLPPDRLPDALKMLRDADWAWFDHLSAITCSDLGAEADPRFKLLYHLFSYPLEHELLVISAVQDEAGRYFAHSASGLWPGAEWHEREIFDLFGVEFAGHPDLRRIFMPEDWPGHPLRRDYQDPESYHGILVGYYDPTEEPSA